MKNILRALVLTVLFVTNIQLAVAQVITKVVYKKTPTRELTMQVFSPEDIKSGDKRAAVVFFFGGGWKSRNLNQFKKQAQLLAKKGLVCFIADYRVFNTDKVEPKFCLMDAKSAIRYVRSHAKQFMIDTQRLVASGGSAGGHLAASTYYVHGFDDPFDDLAVSCKPTALVLFNPVVDNSKEGYGYKRIKEYYPDFSPAHNIKNPLPTIFFVGSEDPLIPPSLAKKYQNKCTALGGQCDLYIYKGQKHGFFNAEKYMNITMQLTVEFLTTLGYIDTIK